MTVVNEQVDYAFPETVEEASQLKARYADRARFIAGGTDLLLLMEREHERPGILIDLSRIPALQIFEINQENVVIGAGVRYSQLLSEETLCRSLPYLAKAIRSIGGVQIRNIATLVGNIVNASPAGDTLPILFNLKATVHLEDLDTRRLMPIEEFVTGVGQTALRPSEIVTKVTFDLPSEAWVGSFQKLGLRRAMAISVANVAVLVKIEGRRIGEARIALGAVAPTVVRARAAEKAIVGSVLEEGKIEEAANLVMETARPIDDIRGSAKYRSLVVGGLLRRALREVQGQIMVQE